MRHVVVALACLTVGVGCGSSDPKAASAAPPARDPLEPYPSTGVTHVVELSIAPITWEVGPGALFAGFAYNEKIPGPAIEVNAGDHVSLRITNKSKEPHSVHTHVVKFTYGNDGTDGSVVPPGETRTLEWDAVFAGTYPYHDHADGTEGVTRGLFGALIVHAPDEKPANEHLVVLNDFDPANYIQLPGVADPVTGKFPDAGPYRGGHQYMHLINGKGYEDAIPAFTGKVGERSRWRVVSIGKEFHTWHLHGHRWLDRGVLTDNIQLGPGMYTTFEFQEDAPGNWLVHCHVPDHMDGGMMARYVVSPLSRRPPTSLMSSLIRLRARLVLVVSATSLVGCTNGDTSTDGCAAARGEECVSRKDAWCASSWDSTRGGVPMCTSPSDGGSPIPDAGASVDPHSFDRLGVVVGKEVDEDHVAAGREWHPPVAHERGVGAGRLFTGSVLQQDGHLANLLCLRRQHLVGQVAQRGLGEAVLRAVGGGQAASVMAHHVTQKL